MVLEVRARAGGVDGRAGELGVGESTEVCDRLERGEVSAGDTSSELERGEEGTPRPDRSTLPPLAPSSFPSFLPFPPIFLLLKNPFPPPLKTPTTLLFLQSFLPRSLSAPVPLTSSSPRKDAFPPVELEDKDKVEDRGSASSVA